MGLKKQDLKSGLSFDALYGLLGSLFDQTEDPRGSGCSYRMSKLLRTGFAIYSLKNPSLVQFEKRSRSESENLKSIYGIEAFCSANCLGQGLDEVSPDELQRGFVRLMRELEEKKVLKHYLFRGKHYLISIDGVEFFCSKKVHCPNCLVRVLSNGEVEYYHQMLVAVLIHPDQREVYPVGCEPIIQQDGQKKNDCERNAAKRLLARLDRSYPDWKMAVLEDGLYSNGPHLRQLATYDDMPYIIGVKPGDHVTLFRQFEARVAAQKHKHYQVQDDQEVIHDFRWANNLPLNSSNADIRVNLLSYTETKPNGKKRHFSWIVHWKITKANVFEAMRGGRARWKIENETFNTLKNQGYFFEHNFGHGTRHLATVLPILMLLAFSIDQIQQHACGTFKLIWQGLKTKKKMWEALRATLLMQRVQSMQQLWHKIAWEYEVRLDSS